MNSKGFTLIELMVILVILGILASIVIPKFVEIQQRKENQKEVSIQITRTVKTEVSSYTEFKKDYTVLMIDKKDTTATIVKDKDGNIWKLKHTNQMDWTVKHKTLIGNVNICTTEKDMVIDKLKSMYDSFDYDY